MVHANRGDDRNLRGDRVGGIHSPAHAGFPDHEFRRFLGKPPCGEDGGQLEKSRELLPTIRGIAEQSKPFRYGGFRDHFPVHPDALAKVDQMRGGVKGGAVTGRAEDGVHHDTGTPFAVRSGHVKKTKFVLRPAAGGEQTLGVFQPRLDAESLPSEKPRERVAVVHFSRPKKWSSWESVSRNRCRATIMSTSPWSCRNSAVWKPLGNS